MATVASEHVIGGPVTIIVSSTTIGHSEEGAVIHVSANFHEITTHESGPVPVAVHQQGGHRFEVEINEAEMSLAALQRVFQDITATTSAIIFNAAAANPTLSSKQLRLIQKGADGTSREWKYPAMVPTSPGFDVVARNADGSKWVVNAKWVGLFQDTSTGYAKMTGLS